MREIAPHDPAREAFERWPGWEFGVLDLRGIREVVDTHVRVALISHQFEDREFALAHLLAHMDLGHHECPGPRFTAEQERQADWLAQVRLDRERTR